MFPELLGKPVIVRYKKHKLEGYLIYFDKNKLILMQFDRKTIEIVLKYDALEPNLYSGEGDVEHKSIFEKLCAANNQIENKAEVGSVQKKVKIENSTDMTCNTE